MAICNSIPIANSSNALAESYQMEDIILERVVIEMKIIIILISSAVFGPSIDIMPHVTIC